MIRVTEDWWLTVKGKLTLGSITFVSVVVGHLL